MGRRVLVVEDDFEMREVEAAVLGLAGYEPVCARTVAEGFASLHDGELPRVILLDLQLSGEDGESFRAAQMREPGLAGIPVVIVSALPSAPEAASRLRLRLLQKPFDADALIDVVRQSEGA